MFFPILLNSYFGLFFHVGDMFCLSLYSCAPCILNSLDRPLTFSSPSCRAEEKVGLKQSLVASRQAHISSRSQLEQDVLSLKKEVTRLELELGDTQKVWK